jgi:hypothetical protein
MTTFAEQLKTLTDAELDKLERILLMLQHDVFNHDFDELLKQIGIQQAILSPSDADLIGSRIYELEICQNWHPADARKQALEEFNSGKLHPKKKSIPRYKGRAHAAQAALPTNLTECVGNATGPHGSPTEAPSVSNASEAAQTPATLPDPLPDNVVPFRPLRLYSKFFHNYDARTVW